MVNKRNYKKERKNGHSIHSRAPAIYIFNDKSMCNFDIGIFLKVYIQSEIVANGDVH